MDFGTVKQCPVCSRDYIAGDERELDEGHRKALGELLGRLANDDLVEMSWSCQSCFVVIAEMRELQRVFREELVVLSKVAVKKEEPPVKERRKSPEAAAETAVETLDVSVDETEGASREEWGQLRKGMFY